ncbi:uncharacterized protein LOC129411632 [Boleophthalmus pectinirostris]|uniref:uncharacterized protein LOC129411632 n=1 Tax=Boleophthalmus pectinirostris TaxID=150288 RepID=UPI00242D030F|nr:uncharacterized protein LOC129411632 [Boleophthalmus pectinirostris]XP_055019002.1 uncharacterized protein LOC129411632 [Boleophthalmus pectinirostris]
MAMYLLLFFFSSLFCLTRGQDQKPDISLQHHDSEVLIGCALPPSATGSKCNLYFGEAKQPHSTINSWTVSKDQGLCHFSVSMMKFQENLSKVQSKVVSCDYALGNGSSSLSPRSDGFDLRDFMSKYPYQPHVTTASLNNKGYSSVMCERQLWLMVPMSCACGVVIGIVVVIFGFFCSIKIEGKHLWRGSQGSNPGHKNTQGGGQFPVDINNSAPVSTIYSSTGSEAVDNRPIHNEDEYDDVRPSRIYMSLIKTSDVYATIHNQQTATPRNINLV